MQIWKFQYPENFAFLILRILELFTRDVYIFLKKVGYFLTYPFVSVCL